MTQPPQSTSPEPARARSKRAPVDVAVFGRGVVLDGTSSDVAAFIDHLVTVGGDGVRRVGVGDLFATATAATALYDTHREYIEFSAKTLQNLRRHGALATKDGFFRGYVKDAAGNLTGNVTWRSVKVSPEQALSLQTAAASLALRAAVKDVAAAVKRIEGKVDDLVTLVRADRLGTALGDRTTLESALSLLRENGVVSHTDWVALAPLGPEIARDIARLRAHLLLKLADVKRSQLARTRADQVEKLSEQLVRESMALLVVVEHNYGLWQELRMARIQEHEPAQLPSVVRDVQLGLDDHNVADQVLVDAITQAAGKLTAPTGFEGFEPWQRRRLSKVAREMGETVTWFASQRNLDADAAHHIDYPDLQGSATAAAKLAGRGAQSATRLVGRGLNRVRKELSASTDQTGDLD